MLAGVGYDSDQESLARPVSALAGKDTARTAACPKNRHEQAVVVSHMKIYAYTHL